MAGDERPRSVGELIRLSDGAAWPLTLPITLIGSGDQCDVRIDGAELHCALTLTPAGLALRSWNPDATTVEGRPTAAALLANGQEIVIGEEVYRLNWNVPASPAHSPDLLEQLQQAREQFRLERKVAAAELAKRTKRLEKAESEVRAGEAANADEKKRVRVLYEKCLERIRVRWAAERKSCGHARAEFETEEARFREHFGRKKADLDKRAAQAEEDRARLKAAWELLAEGQRRAIADRQQAEEWLARQRDSLDLRAKMLQEQHKLAETNRQALEGRQPHLIAEVAGLEARATHLRQAIAKLEENRDKLLAAGNDPASKTAVSLAPQPIHRGEAQQVDSLLVELTREKRTLSMARAEFQAQLDDLADQRAVLAEQIAALANARDLWQSAEAQTADELHALALGVRSEEQALDGRERDLLAAERRRRSEDHALVEQRFKLENWQLALMAKEASVQTEAEKLDTTLAMKRDALENREATLEATAAAWTELRGRELDFYRAELDRVAVAKADYAAAVAELRQAREDQAERHLTLGARELASAPTTRRGRVLERRWTARFRKEEKRLGTLERKLEAQRIELEERTRRLHRQTEQFLERQKDEMAERTSHELDRHAAARRLADAQLEAELEAQLRFRTEGDARRLRGEIARMAEAIRSANLTHPDEPDVLILPLQSAQAA